MSNVRICLPNNTAKLVREGAPAIWVPFRKQPSSPSPWDTSAKWEHIKYFAPCHPGDTVRLLETWLYEEEDGYYCKADADEFENYSPVKWEWRSPATMPNIACRHVWTVGSVQAVQFLKSLTKNDTVGEYKDYLNKLGFELGIDALDWLTTTYPHLSLDAWGWYIERITER